LIDLLENNNSSVSEVKVNDDDVAAECATLDTGLFDDSETTVNLTTLMPSSSDK